MATPAGSITLKPNQTNYASVPNSGKGLIITNNSGYSLNVSLEGCATSKTLPSGVADFFPIYVGFSGTVVIQPSTPLPNVLNYPGKSVSFDLVGRLDTFDSSAYPMSIAAVQAVSPTASGKALFTATVGFGSTATLHQVLNIFNPPNSGVTANFHSIRAFTSSGVAGCRAFIELTSGADNNLTNPVSIVCHDGNATPRVSVCHATSFDSNAALSGTLIETPNTQANVTQDFLTFPDNYTLYPGNNLWVDVDDPSTTGNVVRLTMKWSEDQAPPPTFVAVGGGQQAIATSLINDGQPASTQIIESRPVGDGTSAVLLTNDAQFLLGDASNHGFFKGYELRAADDSLGLVLAGAAGQGTELVGKLFPNTAQFFQFLHSFTNAQIDGTLNLNPTGLVDNGDTSGSATMYQLLVGNVKCVVILQGNFQQAGGAINRALPTAFTSSCLVWASGVGGFSLLSGGGTQTVKRYTAIGAGGFTTTNNTTVNGDSLNDGPGFDTVQYSGGNVTAHNGIIFIIGV